MTTPERRRPLPALVVIAALCVLTAIVWFRVLHRSDASDAVVAPTTCPTPSPTQPARPRVLPVPKRVSVVVLNSTQRNGIAGATKRVLSKRGFKVVLATDDAPQYGGHGLIKGVAEIRYGPRALAGATLLAHYFPSAKLKATDSTGVTVTVSLGAKFRKVATAAAVHRSVARAHQRLSAKVTPPRPSPSPSPTC
jgi:hypothetical protein